MGAILVLLAVTAAVMFLGGFLRAPNRLVGGITGMSDGLSRSQLATLKRYFLYYGRLTQDQQERFRRLMAAFMNDKEWKGVGMEVKEEMKVMISAAATQLLFGMPDLTLMHFSRILVYPKAYRGRRDGRLHQGSVDPGLGVIRISWSHYLAGYAHPGDAHNVALHEMAHALWFEEIIPNAEVDFFDDDVMASWKRLAAEEIERIHKGAGHLFRDYAGTNQEEFFAVAVEYFFEQPEQFREKMPELYETLKVLLRQDPAWAGPAEG